MQVIKEVLRLYPPSPAQPRDPTIDHDLGGVPCPPEPTCWCFHTPPIGIPTSGTSRNASIRIAFFRSARRVAIPSPTTRSGRPEGLHRQQLCESRSTYPHGSARAPVTRASSRSQAADRNGRHVDGSQRSTHGAHTALLTCDQASRLIPRGPMLGWALSAVVVLSLVAIGFAALWAPRRAAAMYGIVLDETCARVPASDGRAGPRDRRASRRDRLPGSTRAARLGPAPRAVVALTDYVVVAAGRRATISGPPATAMATRLHAMAPSASRSRGPAARRLLLPPRQQGLDPPRRRGRNVVPENELV